MRIREFQKSDAETLVTILKLNRQYAYPEVEGSEAMIRVSRCPSALFLVAEENARPVGFIKAVYDGSRAMIHLLSVHPEFQGKGVGSKLLDAAILVLRKRGAPSVSVPVTADSAGFWEKRAFKKLPVSLMLKMFDE
jgi:GNAT superfamily N-acetyltransferase